MITDPKHCFMLGQEGSPEVCSRKTVEKAMFRIWIGIQGLSGSESELGIRNLIQRLKN